MTVANHSLDSAFVQGPSRTPLGRLNYVSHAEHEGRCQSLVTDWQVSKWTYFLLLALLGTPLPLTNLPGCAFGRKNQPGKARLDGLVIL
jgi:hypothetical protein